MIGIGIIEAFVVATITIIRWGIPIAAGVWIILTLRRMRSDQEWMKNKLEAIEQLLQRNP